MPFQMVACFRLAGQSQFSLPQNNRALIQQLLISILGQTVLDGLVLQILGPLHFAFAMINWTAKANLIGGIYGRPIAIGNLSHFAIGAMALVKGYSTGQNYVVLIATGVYVVLVSFLRSYFSGILLRKLLSLTVDIGPALGR